MSPKARRMERLLVIRRLVEELDRKMMELASAAVTEVETAIRVQRRAMLDAGDTARAALTAGDRGEWLLAGAQSEVAGWNRSRLEVVLSARVVEVAPAMEKLMLSRRRHEEIKLLVDDAQQVARVDENRRAQAAADDWFLGRRVYAASQANVNRS